MTSSIAAWAKNNPDQAIILARRARALRAIAARSDVNTFIEYVMTDERFGTENSTSRVRQQSHHRRMQELANEHKYLLIWSHLESGKTHQLSIGRVLWLLGRNPNMRIAIFSSSHEQAVKICRTIRQYIEHSDRLHDVFPDLVPSPEGPWSDAQLTVKRTAISKDPSVQVSSATGRMQGARIDLAILDDMITFDHVYSVAERTHVWEWFQKTIFGRARSIIIIGNAFSHEDLMHQLEKNPLWYGERFPLLDKLGRPFWPEMWPPERVAEVRKGQTPEEFARKYMCVARDDSAGRFKRAWIDACLERGDGRKFAVGLEYIPVGYSCYTGVDLGVRQHRKSDVTVLCTIIVHPNGDKEILEVMSGRWAGPDIVKKIVDVHRRFHSIVFVEDVAAQKFIVDFTRDLSGVPVEQFQTDKRKRSPEFGIESLAVEMSNAKWILPNEHGEMHKEMAALVQEILYYDPQSHTGDRLMAMWIAREGSRRIKPRMQTGRVSRRI